eukprot:366048-Chlamydomonas_euryale.AAC.10
MYATPSCMIQGVGVGVQTHTNASDPGSGAVPCAQTHQIHAHKRIRFMRTNASDSCAQMLQIQAVGRSHQRRHDMTAPLSSST